MRQGVGEATRERPRGGEAQGDAAPAVGKHTRVEEQTTAAPVERGGVDRGTAQLIAQHRLTGAVPAFLAWATGLATDAPRALSGHAEWSTDQLFAWAAQQPDDAAPCRT